MATYQELFNLRNSSTLKNKVAVACTIAANTILTEDPATTNHAAREKWAVLSFKQPQTVSEEMLWALLAENSGLTASQIEGATDTQIQNAVNSAVDLFALQL